MKWTQHAKERLDERYPYIGSSPLNCTKIAQSLLHIRDYSLINLTPNNREIRRVSYLGSEIDCVINPITDKIESVIPVTFVYSMENELYYLKETYYNIYSMNERMFLNNMQELQKQIELLTNVPKPKEEGLLYKFLLLFRKKVK
jgi:hypothetical protein